jgi:hypothetical protein
MRKQDQPLTATVTTAANRCHQRPATAHNSRTIRANWGYVRPEKQTVEDQRRSAATVARPLNNTRRTWTTLEYRPGPRPVTDGPGRLAHSYGSEGPVPAACPNGGATSDSHGLSWTTCQQARRSAYPQVAAIQRHRVPKLIVRVRFPSPAPGENTQLARCFRADLWDRIELSAVHFDVRDLRQAGACKAVMRCSRRARGL